MAQYVPVAPQRALRSGSLLRVEIGARLLCLANVAGTVYAVDDDCTHISGPLDDGELAGCVLTCPLHLAQFDVRDGRVLRGPARDPLRTYPVRIEDDRILVAVEEADVEQTSGVEIEG